MNYAEYISAAMAKDSLGATISVGLFVLVGVYAILGMSFGATRGLTKSVVRFLTVGASAIISLLVSTAISGAIVSTGIGGDNGAQSLEALLNSYSPDLVNSLPELARPVLAEVSAQNATVFALMLTSIVVTPVVFIALFYILRLVTLPIYALLSGLAGAISYGKRSVSSLLGAVVGLAQGLLIAAVVLLPISGLCGIAESAKEPLVDNAEQPHEYVEGFYNDVVADLADNPLFDLVDKFGGKAIYDKMVVVTINDTEYNMGDECVGVAKILTDLLPLTSDFDWKHPTDIHKNALNSATADIGKNELIASLSADVLRGVAISYNSGNLDLGLSGAAKSIVKDVMTMFSTTDRSTVEGDIDLLIDIYFIICDRNIISSLTDDDPEAVRNVLTAKGEDGTTPVDAILFRLNDYDRAAPIVTSFTKISLSAMMGSTEFDEETEQLYEEVKQDIVTVLNHNKSDYETEEEYKAAVTEDLDKALAENDIVIEEEIKQNMVDYIADNYGDHEGEITDKEINDAILSYYKAYTDAISKGEAPPELPPELDDINPDELPDNGGEEQE